MKKDSKQRPEITRIIMMGVAVIAFSGSIITGVLAFYFWKEQERIETLLSSIQYIGEQYSRVDAGMTYVSTTTWQEYSDSSGTFSFLYPRNWYILHPEAEAGSEMEIPLLEASSVDSYESEEEAVFFGVYTYPLGSEDASLTSHSEYLKYHDDGELIESPLNVGAEEGVLFVQGSEDIAIGRMIFVSCGDDLFKILTSSSSPEAERMNSHIMRSMMETFTFPSGCGPE
jgi:hypothetical protein